MSPWIRHMAGLALLVAGCRSLGLSSDGGRLPAAHRLVQAPFVIVSDFRVRPDDQMVRELVSLQEQVQRELSLERVGRQIEIYIFDDRGSYESFIRARYPRLPQRRAFFIADERGEVVYTFRGQRLSEDLRHEATHALLHAAFGQVPLWLDEGLAEYFEVPPQQHGMHRRHLGELVQQIRGGWRPGLTRLETLTDVSQMQTSDYREAWAWVYYLLHGPSSGRSLLLEYLADCGRGGQPQPPAEPFSARLFRAVERPDQSLVQLLSRVDDGSGSVGQ